ncbi:MAG: hypothetical protein R2713_22305 [Ilumatobacteraceae bacterium]
MIEINVAHDGFWGLSPEINEAGLAVVEEKEIAANSADGTYCSIDADRAQGIYDTVKAVYDAQGVEITDDVASRSIRTSTARVRRVADPITHRRTNCTRPGDRPPSSRLVS